MSDIPRDSDSDALAETWNGSTWTLTIIRAVPVRSLENDLRSVSCPSATSCLAVGTWWGNSPSSVLADSWNGKTWKLLPEAAGFGLTGVSCTSGAHCVVVGDTADPLVPSAAMAGLADVWNGKKWSALKLPWPRSGNSYLGGVSCTKAGNCATAGGEDVALRAVPLTGKAAAATWNGKAWTIAKLPALHAGRSDVFSAVSCPSATECVAVGHYGPNATLVGAGWAGVWNGKTWKQAAV